MHELENPGVNMTYRYFCASDVSNALWVVGGQWTATITFLLGLERLLAVKSPGYYIRFTK